MHAPKGQKAGVQVPLCLAFVGHLQAVWSKLHSPFPSRQSVGTALTQGTFAECLLGVQGGQVRISAL